MLTLPPSLHCLDIFFLSILNAYSFIHSAGICDSYWVSEPVLGAVVTAGKKKNPGKIPCHMEGRQ